MAGDNPPLTVPGVSNSVFGRYTRTVLVGVALLGAAFIFVGVRTAPSLSWLSKNGGINWIIYPAPPDLVQRPSCELSTVFKRSLTLNEVPREARLRVAGLRRWAVVVNRAQARSKTAGTTPNQPAEFTITNLHQGENTILVTVSNSNGPPALWLSLEAGDVRLSSDESWEASYAGAAWRPARLADKPPVVPAGNAVFGGAAAYDALRERLLLLLVCVIVTGGITLVHFRLRSRKATMDSNVGDPSAWRVLVATHWPLLLAIILWSALIVNNLAALPPLVGFDVNEHVQFIRFIQEHNALPPPGEGWELFQPPLYYILSAMLLKVCGLSVSTSAGVAVLRLFGLVVGIAHLALIWVALRLLFPADRARQIAGLCVAASLAPLIYLSQYVTNEGLAAMLATACLFLGLRIFRNSQPSWLAFVGLGACLGAALLTKLTAILLLPSVLGAFLLNAPNLWPALVSPNNPAPTRPARIGLQLAIMSAACFTVCGWHYYRVYQQFGNPLVGAWIPASGFSWWQDPGYHSLDYFLRFGASLVHPWFSALSSFPDGIYTTLWGDGLRGGASGNNFGPPWNYDLMALGYWLALLPTMAVLVGVVVALRKLLPRPRPEWLLLLGFGCLVILAVVHRAVTVPYFCMVKGFYGMAALLPFSIAAALGFEWCSRRLGRFRYLLIFAFGFWASVAYVSFWVPRSSSQARLSNARYLLEKGNANVARALLVAELADEPGNTPARSALVSILMDLGDDAGALTEAQQVLATAPNDAPCLVAMATLQARHGEINSAIEIVRKAISAAPGYRPAYNQLAAFLMALRRPLDAAESCQEGLAIAPYNVDLHRALAAALRASGKSQEAESQFLLAFDLDRDRARAHTNLGAELLKESRLDEAIVHLREAVRLKPEFAGAHGNLGAALATAGKLDEAIEQFREALRLNPDYADAKANLQRALAMKSSSASGPEPGNSKR